MRWPRHSARARVRRSVTTPHDAPATRPRPMDFRRLSLALVQTRLVNDSRRSTLRQTPALSWASSPRLPIHARRSRPGLMRRRCCCCPCGWKRASSASTRTAQPTMSCGCGSIRTPARSTTSKLPSRMSRSKAAGASGSRRGRLAASKLSGAQRGGISSRATASAAERGS